MIFNSIKKCQLRVLFALFGIFFIFVSLVFSQPENSEKQVRAKTLYDEALALNDERTAKIYREALEKFRESSRLYFEIGDDFSAGKSLVGVGITLNNLEESGEALKEYEKALAIFQKLKNVFWEARTLNNIAHIYDNFGEKQKSLEYHFKVLPLRRAVSDKFGEAVTLNGIGSIYLDLGENEKALEYFNLSLPIKKSLGDIGGEAVTLNNIGRVYDNLGDKQKALQILSKALNLRRAEGNFIGEALTLNNIALVFEDLNQTQKALDFYNQAVKIFKYAEDKSKEATTLNNIGAIYLKTGENEKAIEFFQKSIEIEESLGLKNVSPSTLNNLGLAYANLKDKERSLAYFYRALPILRQIGDRNTEAITFSNLMQAWQTFENPQLAVFFGKQSVNKYQELRASIKGLDPNIQKTYLNSIESTYRILADILIEQARFAQAEQVLSMLKEEEFFDFVRRDADEIKNLTKKIELDEREKKILEEYSTLAEKLTEIGLKFQQLDDKKRKLSNIESPLSTEEQKLYDELSLQLNNANEAFRIFLSKQLVAEIGKQKAFEIEIDRNLQSRLRKWEKGTVTLYTVLTENRYRVILTTPTVQVDGKTEISAAELNKKIFEFRDALQNIESDPRPIAKELYDILIKPVEKHLQSAKAETLVWSLDGTLRYIPIAALSPDGKKYLAEQYKTAIITSKTRDDLYENENKWQVLGVGVSEGLSVVNPEKPEGKIKFSPLPGTKNELFQIIKDENSPNETGILPGKRFLDRDFNLQSFSNALSAENDEGKPKFNTIHIASHFRLGNSWMNSFLLLGDGQILTLEKIINSPEISFGNVELITLSACNTAFADQTNGKEVDSLADTIQTKSGKSVLATLWAVVDESTPLVMSEFYKIRKENPTLTKAEAMQIAQVKMINGTLKPSAEFTSKLAGLYIRKQGNNNANSFKFDKTKPFAHPYFWSPFVLIGNWR